MTQSLEDYIEAIYVLAQSKSGAYVHDVAGRLKVKMPSVVKAIRALKDLGLVTQEPYEAIVLTRKGTKVAKMILERHLLLCAFLRKLGVSEEIADQDACRMEHVLSAETIDQIRLFTEGKPK